MAQMCHPKLKITLKTIMLLAQMCHLNPDGTDVAREVFEKQKISLKRNEREQERKQRIV